MRRRKKIVVALLLSLCMGLGTTASTVTYADEGQSRMLYISNYFAGLYIGSDGLASISASLAGKCDANSSSIMIILQRQIGDSWGNVASWYKERDYEYVDIAETYRVSRGTYRCVATFVINTDSGSETKHETTAERTY